MWQIGESLRRLWSEWRKDDWLLVPMIMVIGLMLAGAFWTFVGAIRDSLSPASVVAESFLGALRDEDYQLAFSDLSVDLQESFGNFTVLRGNLLEYNASPQSWQLSKFDIRDDSGEITGAVKLKDGTESSLEMTFLIEEGKWKILFFDWSDHPLIN